jgi:dolichyl-phosphate beta-glucosyltransferase
MQAMTNCRLLLAQEPEVEFWERDPLDEEQSFRPASPMLDLVIPALNEEARIGTTLSALAHEILARELPVRVIVVDDGCIDTTTSVVDSLSTPHVAVEVISCRKRGKGAAVRAGVLRTDAPFVGFCDADLPVPAEALAWALDLLSSGWEVVIGSRRCAGARYVVPQSLGRRAGSALIRALSRDLRGPVADTQCGFKFFTTALARQLFSTSEVDGFAFDLEIVGRALQSGARLIEMPVPWSDREGSSLHAVQDGLRALRDIRRARASVRRYANAKGLQ